MTVAARTVVESTVTIGSALMVFLIHVTSLIAAQPADKDSAAMTGRPITVDDLFAFQRAGAPSISPDGRQVAYAATEITDVSKNQSVSRIWLAPSDGSAPARQLTNPASAKDSSPRWSPDGRWILFESTRSGTSQLWIISPDGGEASQLTNISTGAASAIWSPDSRRIAFVSAVCPEFSELPFAESDKANKDRAEMQSASPVRARVFTKLFYRHWDSYVEDKRQHLFVFSLTETPAGIPAASELHDVTPGDRDAFPTSSTFSSAQDFSFSPDGMFLIFTAVPATDEAWSTNFDLCRVPVSGGTTAWESLTEENIAADVHPVFSPDGTRLAWRSQRKPGYEADRWEVLIAPCRADGALAGPPQSITSQMDLSFDEIVWLGNEQILCTAESSGRKPIFLLSATTVNDQPQRLHPNGTVSHLSISADRSKLACNISRLTHPPEVFAIPLNRSGVAATTVEQNISHLNDQLLAKLELSIPESLTVSGADNDPMQMWILKPPGFDSSKKWPLAFLVHGGPQGAWSDSWSFRWNPQVWAAQGYIVAAPNPRGSTGFGQKYTDQISGDWGGRCYVDLMAGVSLLEERNFVDTDRMFAAGASFGGYMMNWFAGNTTKFRTLINHCGVFNFESMYATTEELWFDEYEHGGPPWGPDRHSYEKHSPHRLAGRFRTPMLIIHNDLDFRVPVSEAQQLFTTLQRQGVPSKFINFPDEGHWVLKPANSRYWHTEIFRWLEKYCPPGAN